MEMAESGCPLVEAFGIADKHTLTERLFFEISTYLKHNLFRFSDWISSFMHQIHL